MIARKVDKNDNSPAGFIYSWAEKIGQKLEKLSVIAWQKSDGAGLSENIEVISLPKNKLAKIFVIQARLAALLPKVDGVFCFQNPEYIFLAAPLAKIFRKKIILWYAHGAAGRKLRWANWLSDKILTSSDKGCRLKNRGKIRVIGQGIDTEKFKNRKLENGKPNSNFVILSVGRISPVKDYETLIEAMGILAKQGKNNIKARIVGGPALKKDQDYFEKIKQMARYKKLENAIEFIGPAPYSQIPTYYQESDLFVNLSRTGSLDKTVLEAMAGEKLVLTSNEAFEALLGAQRLTFQKENPRDLAEKIGQLMELSKEEKADIGRRLREVVVKNHNLDILAERIINHFSND